MKRCPQCEFVYEDDQSLCDMDGILLVFDSQKLPKPRTSPRSHLRSRIVTAVASLVLATVLGLVYYVSTHQRPASRAVYTPASGNATLPSPSAGATSETKVPASEIPASEKKPSGAVTPTESKDSKESVPKSAGVTAPKEATEKPKTKSTPKTRSSKSPSESDSKIGSIIKKTGRLLKKPFKF